MATPKLEIATSTEITIDKNIPRPGYGRVGNAPRYPWATMEVGDSFIVPPEREKHFSRGMITAGRTHNRKFSQRKMPDGTRRCWRIA